jgi:hypothetical protein
MTRTPNPILALSLLIAYLVSLARRGISGLSLSIPLSGSLSVILASSLATVALSICAIALLRVRLTAAALRDRVTFAVLPADEFEVLGRRLRVGSAGPGKSGHSP